MATDTSHIRNFSIIAHVDHGKSTLADRILDVTGALSAREKKEQFLDKLELERERGITIKAQNVRLPFKSKDGRTYQLQLIDTPGHVDFSYEVSRSLAACEGALLVVDATQGVQAQTVANVYLALDNQLELLPVLNKIDLPSSDVDRTAEQIEEVIGLDCSGAMMVSGKTGAGVLELLEAVVERVPPPKGEAESPLRALIFDSWYDAYRGAVVMVRVFEGTLRKGDKVRMLATGRSYEVTEIGCFSPHPTSLKQLGPGEVGFLAGNMKSVEDCKIGDTITTLAGGASEALAGFKEVKPMVYAGIYPTDTADYENLRDALSKLHLNDSSFQFEPDTSDALGFGFRCGFLGLLHMEIIQERLEREYDLDLITTAPSVVYQAYVSGSDQMVRVDNPSKMPSPAVLERIEEPIMRVVVHVPAEYVGAVVALCEERRGIQQNIHFATKDHVVITYELPLSEVIIDFHDKLKSASRGYASMDYELSGYRAEDLVKLDIMVNGEIVDALSVVVHRSFSQSRGRALASKMKELVPRQQYDVAIQAAIGAKIIARTNVRAMRKDVTAKCYGGDISRKRKLLEKQKAGKRRMKQFGKVDVPQEAFLAILKLDS
ncbi:MAG: translation elongation factor 4 [Polyangiaceae bacterium]|nr:translation elongation factor 4 [Polyangiaceae bacterium]MCW5790843.1 translation elongation factor 4 [Polyangiaceae bacterium]